MRILQVHNQHRLPGGEDEVVNTEATLLRQAGHEVVQHITRNPSRKLSSVASFAIAPWNPFSRSQISRLLDSAFDVAHVHNTWYALSPSVFSVLKRSGLRVVTTVHNYRLACINAQLTRDGRLCRDCVGSSPLPGIRFGCYRDSVIGSSIAAATITLNRQLGTWDRYVDAFLVPTPYVAEVLSLSGINKDRIFVQPHLVIDPGARATPPSKSSRILFVGRLDPDKGLHMLLGSSQHVERAGLELMVVGDGPGLTDSIKQAFPKVKFVGHLARPEVERLMKSSRALVFPSSVPESFGLVVAEAMACGLPVVANGELPIVALLSGSSGVVAIKAETDAWTETLLGLADDQLVDRLGASARVTYQETFSPSVGLPSLLRFLRGI